MVIIIKKKPLPTSPKGTRNNAQAKQMARSTMAPSLGEGWGGLLRKPTDKEFRQICLFINEFDLDNRGLQKEQFTVALHNNVLLGFGRLREHADCFELCSLGVVTPFRRQGIGKAIVNKLIENSAKNIYLVCIIPDFFIPFGFQIIKEYPAAIQNKIEYCTQELIVPETYVAMLLPKRSPSRPPRRGGEPTHKTQSGTFLSG